MSDFDDWQEHQARRERDEERRREAFCNSPPPEEAPVRTADTAARGAPREAGQIYTLIPMVMEAIGVVEKGGWNDFDKYKFRGIDDLYTAVHPALVKHQITPAVRVLEHTQAERQSSAGKPMLHVVLKLSVRFTAPDGSFVTNETVGEGMDRGDKAYNKAMSAAMKYALIMGLAIPTGEKIDTENDSPKIKAAPKRTSRKKATRADALEAIKKELIDAYGDDKAAKADALEHAWQTRSWTALTDKTTPALWSGLQTLRDHIKA